jgi:hypothetical protein
MTITVFTAGDYKDLLNIEITWHAKFLLFFLILND